MKKLKIGILADNLYQSGFNGEILNLITKNENFEIVDPVLTYYQRPTYVEFVGITNPYTGIVAVADVESEFKDDVVELMIDEAAAIIAGDIANYTEMQRDQASAERSN